MKPENPTVMSLFQDRRQFFVPFYQRSYVWTKNEQWENLWEDIRAKAEARMLGSKVNPHFLGAVVLEPQMTHGLMGVASTHIIDGQQRLTTLQYILKALSLCLDKYELKTLTSTVYPTIWNSNPDTMNKPDIEKYKLWPTFKDQESYQSAMQISKLEDLIDLFPESFTRNRTLRKISVKHPAPLEAIWFFHECFERWINEDVPQYQARLDAITSAILLDLKLVTISLGEDDDAQVIFETLNGRGARLHATDLIRNYIFMNSERAGENSEDLYNRYWSKFETEYWNHEVSRGRMKKPLIEWFIHSFLQAKLIEDIDLGRLYHEFRRYSEMAFTGHNPVNRQLEELKHFSDLYRDLTSAEGNSPLAVYSRRISPFEVSTSHPLALYIAGSENDDAEKREMLDILVSYVVRRAICKLTTKNYNNVFLSVLKNLSRREISAESLKNILQSMDSENNRWPNDDQFRHACITSSIYPGGVDAPKMRAILSELEFSLRGGAKVEDSSPGVFKNLDVDHIMPRSWYEHWTVKGERVERWEVNALDIKILTNETLTGREEAIVERVKSIPRLGNLTLLNLSVNREAQHKSFDVKKDLIRQNTNLRLNIELLDKEWDESEILKRSEKLANEAIKVWPY